MKHIHIVRCEGADAAKYQGYIEPEDGTWRLFVDHEGFPHLLVQVTAEGEKPGESSTKGMANVNAFLIPGFESIAEIMLGSFGGHVSAEEAGELPPGHVDFGPGPHDFG